MSVTCDGTGMVRTLAAVFGVVNRPAAISVES